LVKYIIPGGKKEIKSQHTYGEKKYEKGSGRKRVVTNLKTNSDKRAISTNSDRAKISRSDTTGLVYVERKENFRAKGQDGIHNSKSALPGKKESQD